MGVVGGNILNGEHLDKIVGALAGDGSGGGKFEGGGLRIAAMLLFHEHVIFLQGSLRVRGGQRRNGRTNRFPMLLTVTIRPGSAPPAGWIGWLERGSRMLLPRRTISVDGRHVRTVLQRSDASDYLSDYLFPLPVP